jgi:glycosyltransferase involved in cell wall biosynthesis
MKILLEAPILTQSGYGEHSRLVFESIKSVTQEIYINPLAWGSTPWIVNDTEDEIHKCITKFHEYNKLAQSQGANPSYDVQIHVGIPNEFSKKAPYSVCVTAGIETNRVSANWLMKTHQGIDKLIVPSEHSKSGFTGVSYEVLNKQNNQKTIVGCNCPIDVVPYPVKVLDKEEKVDLNLKTDFNFLTVALLGPRKNIENSIEWFMEEFKNEENVGLVIKTALARSSLIDRIDTKNHLKKVIGKYKESKCKLYLLHGNMSEAEIDSLYRNDKIKAYVTATHGEGYGLPIFEAAYNGMPVIATDWSAHLDFLTSEMKENGKVKNKKMFAKVNYSLAAIPKEVEWKDILVEDSQWAIPDKNSFQAQLRKVHTNYGMYKKWAKTLKENILETHSKKNVIEQMNHSIFGPLGINIDEMKKNSEWFSEVSEIEEI